MEVARVGVAEAAREETEAERAGSLAVD